MRTAFDQGLVHVFVSAAFVERLVGEGRRLRQYELDHNGSVNCSAAPDDELLVARFHAPLDGVQQVDAVLRLSIADAEYRAQDIPFDVERGEIVMMPKIAVVRTLPAHVVAVELFAHDAGGERPLGRYRLNHSPWQA